MNPQIMASIRSTLLGIGGGFVSSGVITSSTMQTAVGATTYAIAFAWSFWGHRKDGIIGAAAALSEVSKIVTTPAIADSATFALDSKVVAPMRNSMGVL